MYNPVSLRSLKGYGEEITELAHSIRNGSASRDPDRRFVVFGRGRTGSTLLVQLLGSHPEIACLGELLNRPRLAPVAYVEHRLARLPESRRGFKLLSYQVRDIAGGRRVKPLRDWITGSEMTLIHMQRENLLRHALSNIYARTRKAFHSHQDGARSQTSMSLDFDSLMQWIAHSESLRDWEAEFLGDLPRETVRYESDLATPEQQQATANSLFKTLGLTPSDIATALSPVTPRDYHSFISNWDDVATRLADTPYARFLDS